MKKRLYVIQLPHPSMIIDLHFSNLLVELWAQHVISLIPFPTPPCFHKMPWIHLRVKMFLMLLSFSYKKLGAPRQSPSFSFLFIQGHPPDEQQDLKQIPSSDIFVWGCHLCFSFSIFSSLLYAWIIKLGKQKLLKCKLNSPKDKIP